MNKSITKKLILSVASLAATTICLTSTTYAWFARNANAWTEEFTVKIGADEGLQISVDGVNFYDSIDRGQMLKAIALSRYNRANQVQKTFDELTDAEVNSYSYTALAPVSPNADFDFFGFSTIDNQVENFDNFIVNGLYMPVNLTENNKTKSYIEFDLYFRNIPSSREPKETYNLIFVNDATAHPDQQTTLLQSYIDALPSTVKLNNKLNVPESKDLVHLTNKGQYVSGEEITINPKDAMRIGVRGTEGDLIYEINEGFGSSAYNNCPATLDNYDLHDPNQNPMVTYFNNTHTKANLYVKDYQEYVETIKNFENSDSLGKFNRNADGTYNDVKITVYLWLDGYDADYLEGVNTDSVHFYLNFTKVGE